MSFPIVKFPIVKSPARIMYKFEHDDSFEFMEGEAVR